VCRRSTAAVEVLVDTFGRVRRHLNIAEDADQPFESGGRILGRRLLVCVSWFDNERHDRRVFRQLWVLLAQDAEDLTGELSGEAQRTHAVAQLVGGLN